MKRKKKQIKKQLKKEKNLIVKKILSAGIEP